MAEDPGGGKRLKERVSFYEKVWSSDKKTGTAGDSAVVDVAEMERRLAAERLRRRQIEAEAAAGIAGAATQLLRSPTVETVETVERVAEEGDVWAGTPRLVTVERVTVRRSLAEVTSPVTKSPSLTSLRGAASSEDSSDGSEFRSLAARFEANRSQYDSHIAEIKGQPRLQTPARYRNEKRVPRVT